MNIYSKVNKSIADVAARVMAEQPAKVEDHKSLEPISSTLVDQVVKAGMSTRFDIAKKHLQKENKVLWNAKKDDLAAAQHKDLQKLDLPHKTGMPNPHSPLEHNKTTSASAEDGSMSRASMTSGKENMTHKESIDSGLINNYAIKMPGVKVSKKMLENDEEPPFEGPYKKSSGTHKDEFGNKIKTGNIAKHLAKKALAKVVAAKKGNKDE